MGTPSGRCGFEYTDESGHESCCYRETWRDRERCVWHEEAADDESKPIEALRAARVDAEVRADCERGPTELLDGIDVRDETFPAGMDFSGASLRDADLSETNLPRADLSATDLRDATLADADLRGGNLAGADCWEAELADVYLVGGDLTGVDLKQADCSDANLRSGALTGANLEGASLAQADLFDATLTDARLYGTVLDGARANEGTDLDEYCVYDPASDAAAAARDEQPAADGGVASDVDRLTKAEATYQELAELCGENALLDPQSRYFVRRQDIHTAEHRREGRWYRWLRARVSRAVVLYGESPTRVLAVAAAVILGSALLYPLGWFRDGATGEVITYPPPTEPVALAATLAESVYFATMTFTTMTFGLFAPVGPGKFLTMVETGAGIVLMALLVFVFGRRATR